MALLGLVVQWDNIASTLRAMVAARLATLIIRVPAIARNQSGIRVVVLQVSVVERVWPASNVQTGIATIAAEGRIVWEFVFLSILLILKRHLNRSVIVLEMKCVPTILVLLTATAVTVQPVASELLSHASPQKDVLKA